MRRMWRVAIPALLFVTMARAHVLPDNQVIMLAAQDDPTISFRVWFKVGSQDDPPGKPGLAAITASMLADASTRNNRYDDILDKLFPLAASYQASTSVEMTIIAGRTHRDNLDAFYPLFLDAVLAPAFRQEDLDRIKGQTLNFLEHTLRYANDEELGKAVLYSTIYAGTPYGHLTEGTVESVRGITLADVQAFYRSHFTRENVIVGVGGGYPESLIDRMRHDFARLPEGTPAQAEISAGAAMRGYHVTIVEKDAAATAISLGMPIDVHRGSKEWYALSVANSWFGEHRNSSSHLYQVIRERRGLNYGDYSYIERFPDGGVRQLPPQNVCLRSQLFEIWIRPVPSAARLFAVRAALRELHRLVQNGLTQDEFDLTKKFLSKYVLHYAASTMERLAYALDDRFYGIDGSHLERFRAMLNTLTLADVNAAIRKHLRGVGMEIVFVTHDAAGLKDALVRGLPSPVTYETPKPPDILEEDRTISTFPVPVSAEDVSTVPAGTLFER